MNYRKTYKKRKAFHITIIAISVIAGLYFNMMLPGVIRDNVPCVDVIFPERTEYIPSVTCSGTVGYSQVRSIKEEIPLIIKEYLVNVGDRVDQGQTIAVVDKQAVCDKLSNIYSGSVSDVLTAAELSDRIPEEIPALVSGTVCYLAKSGELIDAGADIARVGGKGALVLNVAVPERNLSKIRKGQTALLTLSSVDGKFAGQVIMNVHVKSLDGSYDHEIMRKIVANIRKYDCANHVYFMLELDDDICTFRNYAPDINVCVGHDKNRPWALVDRAIELGAQKIQLFKPYFNQKMIDKAKAYGIICNMFYADDPNEARHYLDMGVDTVLTNEYCIVSQVLK